LTTAAAPAAFARKSAPKVAELPVIDEMPLVEAQPAVSVTAFVEGGHATEPAPLAPPLAPSMEPQPIVATQRAEPHPLIASRPIPELPPVALTLPPESGLELVETRFRPAPTQDEESIQTTGARRVRPPKVTIPDEPLQLVETHKDEQPPAG
jgi:hypothetical protein